MHGIKCHRPGLLRHDKPLRRSEKLMAAAVQKMIERESEGKNLWTGKPLEGRAAEEWMQTQFELREGF